MIISDLIRLPFAPYLPMRIIDVQNSTVLFSGPFTNIVSKQDDVFNQRVVVRMDTDNFSGVFLVYVT